MTQKEEIEKARRIGFSQGAVLAIAQIILLHDEPTVAKDVLMAMAPDFKYCAEIDLKVLRKYFPNIPKGIK